MRAQALSQAVGSCELLGEHLKESLNLSEGGSVIVRLMKGEETYSSPALPLFLSLLQGGG